ncbi:ABC transporter substrate-binding protein [Actinomadura bangladeshensis]|uniref:ABC transporter substrate-binding protein n=1 Tax=Actinomadura bangladeshensis TaxID=453573 RepID=A0A6L9QE31_9ACTN|nr:ABC transporter substrate-binding protein [Actinomadura bangladeshensis]NEA23711.1 ABC transporter substrate-binding protein [Actinomadura bangladeshensis]
MSASHRRATVSGALAIAVALTAVACGDSDDKKSANGLEKSNITLGTMTVADTAPVQLAISKGYFKAEGLSVKTQVIPGGAAGIPLLKSGRLDFSFGNYVSLLTAATKDPGFKPMIVAEGFQSASKTHTLMVRKDSPYHTVKDLAGKKIGVNTKRNISTLLVRAAAQPEGVEFDEDKNFVEVAPPAMEQALKSKSVEAVQAIEPFGTQMQETMGARMVADLSSGPTADFPIAGYASTEKFAKENPKTVAAFQRALTKAQGECADRKVVQDILPTYAKGIDAKVASTMSYGTYPTSLNATRLQRVADFMQQFGYVDKRIDVKQYIATPSSS